MSNEKINNKERSKDRLMLLKNETLTSAYYFKKTLASLSTGLIIGVGHTYFSANSSIPEWVSLLAASIAAGGYFVVSHMQTLQQINLDVKEWMEWDT
jgi:ABC-type xylose transport system permease subunit